MIPIIELPQATAESTTVAELLGIARDQLGDEAVLELSGELVVSMTCPNCGEEEPVFQQMARLYEEATDCPHCNGRRDMQLTHRITGQEDFLDRTLAQIDVPALGIIRARHESQRIYYELTGDKETFLTFA